MSLKNESMQLDRLCELNVIEQVNNICHTTIVQEAWRQGQEISVHGWIYGVNDGLIKDLGVCISKLNEIDEIYRMATDPLESVATRSS
jgi:carbonic anhydrase